MVVDYAEGITNEKEFKIAKLNYVLQGPRSNFEIGEGARGGGGGGTFSASILRGHKRLFLTNSL